MKASWKGMWRGGELTIETENPDDLVSVLAKLRELSENPTESETTSAIGQSPKLSGNIGCSEAIKQSLTSSWGRVQPRTMTELQKVFEENALFFSKGTLSGVLTYLVKNGQIRRLDKNGKWAYVSAGN